MTAKETIQILIDKMGEDGFDTYMIQTPHNPGNAINIALFNLQISHEHTVEEFEKEWLEWNSTQQ